MVKKIKTCVFISGNGSNLNSLIKNSKSRNFPIKIELVISNNLKSNGLKIAKKNGINSIFIIYKNKIKFEKLCLNKFKKYKIEFICLAGFMKLLSFDFIITTSLSDIEACIKSLELILISFNSLSEISSGTIRNKENEAL